MVLLCCFRSTKLHLFFLPQKMSGRVIFITETTSAYALLAEKGKAFIFPKRQVANYFDLTEHEQRACNIVLNRVKRLFDKGHEGREYEVKIEVNKRVLHTCIELIIKNLGNEIIE